MRDSCIFCREPAAGRRVEHILPESLGGKDWATLPPGVVCDGCNQYFGSKVEGPALNSFPFSPFRLLLGIATKKGRRPKMGSALGVLRSGPQGTLDIEPRNAATAEAIASGRISQLRIPAVPTEPVAVCRLLLKMALEVVADASKEDALSQRFNEAREFARAPAKGAQWWFLIATDHTKLFERFRRGVSYGEWLRNVHLSISEVEGEDVFHLKLLDLSLITPVRPVFEPAPDLADNEPEWIVHSVEV